MDPRFKEEMLTEFRSFDLPGYNEIPNIGLFLDQTNKYIAEYLAPLDCVSLTNSMISNYVKKKILKNPVRKQYDREQIACLIFIAVTKTVLSLEDIQLLLELQRQTCETEKAYEYFRKELKRVLNHVLLSSDPMPAPDSHNYDEKSLLRSAVITVAHKVYLDKYFRKLREAAGQED